MYNGRAEHFHFHWMEHVEMPGFGFTQSQFGVNVAAHSLVLLVLDGNLSLLSEMEPQAVRRKVKSPGSQKCSFSQAIDNRSVLCVICEVTAAPS